MHFICTLDTDAMGIGVILENKEAHTDIDEYIKDFCLSNSDGIIEVDKKVQIKRIKISRISVGNIISAPP